MARALLAVALMAAGTGAAAQQAALGIVTILDGEAQVIRGSSRFPGAEGLRLESDDVVQTTAKGRLLRIEFQDGTALDLGPSTHLMLRAQSGGSFAPQPRPGEPVEQIYLSQGWVKLTPPKGGPSGKLGLASRQFDLADLSGTVVIRSAADAVLVFMESGAVTVSEPRHSANPRQHPLTGGKAFVRQGKESQVLPRPPAATMAGMPRAFADSLPLRAARFLGTEVQPAAGQPITYEDVAEWINSPERTMRTAARDRWSALAADGPFRDRVIAEMSAHPEWDRIIFPEKYLPKRPPADRSSVTATSANPAAVPAATPAAIPASASPPLLPYRGPANPPPPDSDSPAKATPLAIAR